MGPSLTISLFTQTPATTQRPIAFLVSLLLHSLAIALLSLGFLYTPRLDTLAIAEQYTVRRLDLEAPAEHLQRSRLTRTKLTYPTRLPADSPAHPRKSIAAPQAALPRIAQARPGPQTLLQPDLDSQLTLDKKVPVPTLMIWSRQHVETKSIVAPRPAPPTAADVIPSPDAPLEDAALADLNIEQIDVPHPKLAVLPGTTSPVAVHDPGSAQQAPATVSQIAAPPTPTAILSLSDLRMQKGAVVLPPVNETAAPAPNPASTPALANPSAPLGIDAAPSPENPSDSAAATSQPAQSEAFPTGEVAQPAPKKNDPGQLTGASQQSLVASDPRNRNSVTEITLPRDGDFGSVIIGGSIEDQFPDVAQVWNGRMAYTVYLHVGLVRSWILEYSLPRSQASAGNLDRIDAPWPYDIVRPNLVPGSVNSDALMVHGFVNQAGRFEALSILFPPQFAQAQFVLGSLAKWQFRPAQQNGQLAMVEVLLIIPEELN